MKKLIPLIFFPGFLLSCGGSSSDFERWAAIYNGRGLGVDYKLGIAFSNKLEGQWSYDNYPPVLSAPEGYDQLVKPTIGKVNGEFYLYAQAMNFHGRNATSVADIFLYTSRDGLNWTLKSRDPVLRGGSRPAFLFEPNDYGNEFKMWYRAQGETSISYASSSNGVNWIAHGTVMSNGAPGTFDSNNASPGAVVKVEGKYHLFYEAADDKLFFNAGEVSFYHPMGEYTKNPSNPVLRRERDSESSLTHDASVGDYLIYVKNANVFSVNQPLIIFDEAARWELIRPVHIADSTKIILSKPLLQSYSLESKATIRSWAFAKIYISDAKYKNKAWYIYATAFDPYKDIASGPLEMTGFASGSDLSSLKWDYSRSPLFSIDSSMNSNWNGYARENPVIFELSR